MGSLVYFYFLCTCTPLWFLMRLYYSSKQLKERIVTVNSHFALYGFAFLWEPRLDCHFHSNKPSLALPTLLTSIRASFSSYNFHNLLRFFSSKSVLFFSVFFSETTKKGQKQGVIFLHGCSVNDLRLVLYVHAILCLICLAYFSCIRAIWLVLVFDYKMSEVCSLKKLLVKFKRQITLLSHCLLHSHPCLLTNCDK